MVKWSKNYLLFPKDGNPAEETTHTEPFPFFRKGLQSHFRIPWDFGVKARLQFRQIRWPDFFKHFRQNREEPLYLFSLLQNMHFLRTWRILGFAFLLWLTDFLFKFFFLQYAHQVLSSKPCMQLIAPYYLQSCHPLPFTADWFLPNWIWGQPPSRIGPS